MLNYKIIIAIIGIILTFDGVILQDTDEKESNSIFFDSPSEDHALGIFNKNTSIKVIADDLELSISRGWWKLSKSLIIRTHEQGLDFSAVVRSAELTIRKELDELTRLLNKKHDEIATLSPAFQWAQSLDNIYLNVKFTYRWNAPGALKVENKTLLIEKNTFYFSGLGSHSHEKKKYILELELFDEVDPTLSECSSGSVGKLSCTLMKKKGNNKWPRLLKDKNLKILNMHVWWEMKEKHENDFYKDDNSTTIFNNNKNSSSNNEVNNTINDEL
ncbi:hypothetical protein FG386_000913 [Cryptosporidium ryanae]|uniref:uncharacterized protein n=1 Tax=Cryptosporidium ryanae TaxID=515981 RepID=UPI00351A0E26|nr:hypothetical protein FG386_000913 [Cryptosporidium ryanae]